MTGIRPHTHPTGVSGKEHFTREKELPSKENPQVEKLFAPSI